MDGFPRTQVGDHSLSRLIVGTNWFLGWSHCTRAKDDYIKAVVKDRKVITEILEVFLAAGVDTVMGLIDIDELYDAVQDAQERTGRRIYLVTTPTLPCEKTTAAEGFDLGEVERVIARQAERGAVVCMPHQTVTDRMVDRCTRTIRQMDPVCALIREHGMAPGFSTHMPETLVYADETGTDVDTYITPYNLQGFLMQLEVDWIARIIQNAKQPVMTIKPMAAGQIRPFQALSFVWNTIRTCDMVTAGTMSANEAAELVELSRSILDNRQAGLELQETRSKASVKKG